MSFIKSRHHTQKQSAHEQLSQNKMKTAKHGVLESKLLGKNGLFTYQLCLQKNMLSYLQECIQIPEEGKK
jgi:hypothetical protein